MDLTVSSGQMTLDALLELARKIFTEKDQEKLLHYILNKSVELVEGDRGTIFLLNQDEGTIDSLFALGIEKEISINLDKGIVGEVIRQKTVLNIQDAYNDSRFYPEVDIETGYRTETIVCAPIQSSDGKILGAIEILNSNKGLFDNDDESILIVLSMFLAISLENQYRLTYLRDENEQLRKKLDMQMAARELVGNSEQIEQVRKLITTIARHSSNIIIQGESGTGKEIVASLMHHTSDRKDKPFIVLNCAAIPETLLESELFGIKGGVATGVQERVGRLEQANGGTLFLDELGDMSLILQAKLLRVIQEQKFERVGGKDPIEINVRFLAATNKDLKSEIKKGGFREDLYYRLNVVEIKLPPLRDRKSDVPLLVNHFLERLNKEGRQTNLPRKKLAAKCMEIMIKYYWPGNVRQLENEVQKAFIMSGEHELIMGSHLSEDIKQSPNDIDDTAEGQSLPRDQEYDPAKMLSLDISNRSLHQIVDEVNRSLIIRTLESNNGNKSKTARMLGISREGLRKMLNRFDIT